MRLSPFTHSDIQLKPSLILMLAEVLVIASAVICVAVLKLYWLLKLAVIPSMVLYLAWLLHQQGWLRKGIFGSRVQIDASGWQYTENDHTRYLSSVEAVKLTGWVLFLKGRMENGKMLHFSIWRDSVTEPEFKALYVALKFKRFEQPKPALKIIRH